MSFDYQFFHLPVAECVPEVRAKLSKNNTLILKAPTGAGKSTLLPLTLLDENWLNGKKVIMLEPRRIAAKTVAMRMADMIGEQVGKRVGYRIRFENKIGKETQLEVVTEGILTRMLQQDNALEDYGLVIFDEFHERSIHADLAMALCRESQTLLREDLRMLIMSATIDMPQLASMLKCDVVESLGRMFPVNIEYLGDTDVKMIPELTVHAIKKAYKEQEGDILVFLPGQGEIKRTAEKIRGLKNLQVHELFGMLPPSRQMAAIMPDKEGRRKVVLATNIAETSLTIEGIKIVIDSGFERRAVFNRKTGMSRLETVLISKESADQRKGRAGRLTEGYCYRMWSKADHTKRKESGTPEIQEADLASLILELAEWGVSNPNDLMWLTPPPVGNAFQAKELLEELDALKNNKITAHGTKLQKLPTHPRIAHMLLKAQEEGENILALACDLAPLFEERDPLPADSGIDINLRIEALRRYRREKAGGKRLARIEKLSEQYRRLFDIEADNGAVEEDRTGLLIAYAYPERIACARPGNNAQFMLSNGQIAMAGHRDDLAHEPWLAVAQVSERTSGMGKIFLASTLNPQDLAPLVKMKEVVKWDTKKGGMVATNDLRIGNIVLKSTPIAQPDPSRKTEAICNILRKESHLLNWEKTDQLINRISSLKKWNGASDWPDYDRNSLVLTAMEWLGPYLVDVKKTEDLKKIDLQQILYYNLTTKQQEILNVLAPEKIQVPSGSQITLNYYLDASPPTLDVRLQECFGWKKTPKINEGKISILIHLLSPGFKIVQVTSDLESFWKNTYFEVRKELKIKYKKHEWPENPTEAKAIKGVKKK